jgi:hypothetical protein
LTTLPHQFLVAAGDFRICEPIGGRVGRGPEVCLSRLPIPRPSKAIPAATPTPDAQRIRGFGPVWLAGATCLKRVLWQLLSWER